MNQVLRRLYTLVFVRDLENRKLVLGYKKRGFGMNKWNGLGGKVEKGESIIEGARREAKEESGLEIYDLKNLALIEFQFESKMNETLEVHVFCADSYSGTLKECDEMLPQWFDFDKIPYEKMWKDDILWYPMIFKNQLFKAYFLFKDDQETILDYKINEVDVL